MVLGPPENIKLGIGDAVVPLHAHIACFIESDEDLAAAVSFVETGLRGSDHCVILGTLENQRQLAESLARHGLDCDELSAKGRLAIVPPAASADAMLESVVQIFSRMMEEGAQVIRMLGHFAWLEQGWPPAADLIAMEQKICAAAKNYPTLILCLYDLRQVPAIIMRHGGIEAHPYMIQRGSLQKNPLALPPEMALREFQGVAAALSELEQKNEAVRLYRTMFANMRDPLAIVRVDPGQVDPVVVEMNPAGRGVVGCLDTVSCSLLNCFPRLFDAGFSELSRRIISEGGAADIGELAAGAGFYHIRIFALFDNYLGIVFTDTTQRKKTEQALLSLRKLSTALHSTLDVGEILDALIRGATALVEAESGVAALCTSEGVSGQRYLVNGVPWEGETPPKGEVPGRVVTEPRPHLSRDALHDPHVKAELAHRYGVRNSLSAPIVDLRDNLVGFLEMHNKKDGEGFTPFDQDQLASAAQIAGLALRNAHAFRKIGEMGSRLRESIERYRHLVEGLDAIVWEADAETFKFSFVSRRGEAILGYPISQWLEEPDFWVKHLHPEDRERAVAICRLASEEAKGHRFVYRFIAADGRTVWLRDHARVVHDPDGRVRHLRGLMVDITETMAIEESLKKSEARFRATFEGAGIGMALVDTEGRPVQINPALKAMLGYACDRIAGFPLSKLCHPEDAELDRQQFRDLVAGRLPRYQVEKRFIAQDGAELWGRVTFSALAVDGRAPFAIAMVEDITERKKAEAEIAALLAQVQKDAAELEERVEERTSQLEEINAELDSFAHSVSHDLRAPLRAMQGYTEILLEDSTLSESERVGFLKRILSAAQGMDRLIQNLLAYSRLSRQEIMLQMVDLGEVVREAAQQLELASGGKRYRLDIAGDLPEVLGHRAVLVQVVLNLLTNGIKFVPAGVTPRLRIWAERALGSCRLFVRDNGIGIPEEHQERIFKIFERLHGIETYPGTGVGLAIVRKAVTRLGGRIGVESREGEGSTFWIELPLAAGASRPQENPP